MHSLRRAALRASSSAAVAAPKSQVTSFASRFAAVNTTKAAFVPVVRFFSGSAVRTDEGSSRSFEDTADTDAVKAAVESASEVGSTQPSDASVEGFVQEPNGVYGIFVWNIPYRSTEREMFDTFSRFGKVHSLNIGRDARGLSRGFAFVYYQELEEAKKAMAQADGAFWQGRRIGAKPKAQSDGQARDNSASNSSSSSSKPKSQPSASLYVGNIPYEATDTELNQLFSGLENVLDVRVAIDKATGWPRGFAHADFADIESAGQAMEKLSTVSIQGRLLRVDYSESKRPQTEFNASDEPGPTDKVL